MATSDVARLRFVISADAGGLKSGCKEASGSLKDMNSQMAGGAMRGGEMASEKFFHGMAHKARSLRHFAKDIGESGMLGQFTGLAHMGAGFGVAGLAVGAAGVGVEMFRQHQEELEKDRTNAFRDFRAARDKGVDIGTYKELSALAGEDTKFLDDMAGAMKRLNEVGPRANESLEKLKNDIDTLGHFSGINQPKSPEEERKLLNESFEHRMGPAAPGWGDWFLGRKDKRLDLMQEKLKLSDEEMGTFAKGKHGDWVMQESPTPGQRDAYERNAAKYEKSMQIDENKIMKEADKQHAGPPGMAGAYELGSAAAWNVIANSTMAAQGAGSTDPVVNATDRAADRIVDAIHGNKHELKRAEAPT